MDFSKAERLAAMLEGKVSEQEREELLARMAADDDDLEVFATAAAALDEYEREEEASGIVPIRRRRHVATPVRRRWKPPRWVLGYVGAGGLAVAALLAVLLLPRRGAGGPTEIVAQLTNDSVPAGFEGVAGGVQRSAGADRLSQNERVRLGAHLADLELLARSRSDTAGKVAGRVAELLEVEPTTRELAARYRQIAARPPGAIELDPDLGKRAMDSGGEAAKLGVWLETGLAAADWKDHGFFDSKLSQQVLRGEGPGTLLQRSYPDDLRTLREALESASPQWPTVKQKLDRLLELMAY